MVPGHAIWTGGPGDAAQATEDSDWVLEPFQKGGSVHTFIKHISKGVELATQNPNSLLIFSGGMTRAAMQATEGESYWRLAEELNLYQQFDSDAPKPFKRATTEQFALDSYQNLLFSVARFREMTGHYPSFITVVGFGMKRKRFEELHRSAMRWPKDAFQYIGIDDEGETGQSYTGEMEFGLQPFQEDLYGCKDLLLDKRKTRNPFNRYHSYYTSAPELHDLLAYCPGTSAKFSGHLPWRSKRGD